MLPSLKLLRKKLYVCSEREQAQANKAKCEQQVTQVLFILFLQFVKSDIISQ